MQLAAHRSTESIRGILAAGGCAFTLAVVAVAQRYLLSHALRHPGTRYSIESHRASHDVTYQTARTDLLGLEEKDLLTRSRSGKAYLFTPVSDLYERLQELT